MPELKATIDLETSQFPQNDIAELLDVSPDTLRTWVKRGRLVLSSPPAGRGRDRKYNFLEAVRAGVIFHLSQMNASSTFADEFCDWVISLLIARQTFGKLFDWKERFAIEANKTEVRLSEAAVIDADTGVSHWDHWGVLFENYSELEELEKREYAHVARERLVSWTDEGAEFEIDDAELERPLSAEDYRIAAINEAGPMPMWVIIPIGYMVNSLAVNLFTDTFGPDKMSGEEIR
jgi:hypothetical protein